VPPRARDYRMVITEMARRVGHVLAGKGVVSRYGVDFSRSERARSSAGTCRRSRSTSACSARRTRSWR
jgi:hypothetical protein